MKHIKLFEQFVNEARIWSPSVEVQELLIAYWYAATDTPEGDIFTQKLIEAGLLDERKIKTAYVIQCPNFDVEIIEGRYTKFRGDRKKAIELLAKFTNLGNVKVPSGDYPDATWFLLDMIRENTGKHLRYEENRDGDHLIEYDPEVVDQPSLDVIHSHPSDIVLVKNFTYLPIREALDICIKNGWIKKPVYNW